MMFVETASGAMYLIKGDRITRMGELNPLLPEHVNNERFEFVQPLEVGQRMVVRLPDSPMMSVTSTRVVRIQEVWEED